MRQRERGPTFTNRKIIVAMLLASAILVSTGVAQQQQQSGTLEDPPWLKEFVSKRIVYSVPAMTRVKVVRDLVYKRYNSHSPGTSPSTCLITRRDSTVSTSKMITNAHAR